MKIENKFLNRKFVFSLICILFITLFIFLAIQGYFNLKIHIKNYRANSLDLIDQRIKSLLFEINNFPGSAGSDILFLSELSCMFGAANFVDIELRKQTIKDIEEDFLLFLRANSAYYQLRYIDETGMEIIRADFDGSKYNVISEQMLQDKLDRYYFNETMKLNEREIFVSPLDLNIEGGEIENRGTKNNPIYVPVIRYAIPLFDDKEIRKGILISNIYADYFLEDIRRAQREGEIVFLINNEGYYLAHPNKSKEFAFMFESKEDNFLNDYPEIKKEFLLDFTKRRFESNDLIFTFRYIYPTATSFEIYEGSKQIFGKNPEDKYYWILVSISDKEIINKMNYSLRNSYFFYLLFSGLIILIIFVLVFYINFWNEKI